MYPQITQSLSGELRTLATAHLAQTMHLLEKTSLELEAEIRSELAANPALELVDELRCPGCGRRVERFPCEACLAQHQDEEPLVYLVPRPTSSSSYSDRHTEDWSPLQRLAQPVSLAEHLWQQVAPALSSPAERQAAQYIIERLDVHGLLPEHPAEVAAYVGVPLGTVERVLSLLQQCDPVGVAAANVRECLLIQLGGLERRGEAHPLIRPILEDFWDELAHRSFERVATALGIEQADVEAAARYIQRNLTPYPAQANWGNEQAEAPRQRPDVVIRENSGELKGGLVVEVFSAGRGWLRIEPGFKAALKQLDEETDDGEWREYLKRATLLIKCIQQRNNTMRRILGLLAKQQRGFILQGDTKLIPMTRAEVARQLGLHESTVSRAVANKSVALPNGRVIPLSTFFDRSLAVRATIRKIVSQEVKPLSDTQIAAHLQEQGYTVARRTVAKYRQMLGILPASLRGRAP